MTSRTPDYLDDDDDAVDEAREAFERDVATRGLPTALEACIALCGDKSAPAPARASAANTLVRAAGMFDHKAGEERRRRKEPHEMTPEEINRLIAKIARRQRAYERKREEAGDDGVFN